ncbi:MAG: O-antigen ligase family protein [Eubacteriales bacterium]|nr:O-antigen ligase family protein [Eubacteriales bacterium]
MKQKEFTILQIIFFSSFFVFGLFMEYAACFYTALYGMFLLYRKRPWILHRNVETMAILSMTFFSFLSVFYGVDWGMSLIGCVRMLGILFFMEILMQLTVEERLILVKRIPSVGVCMTVIGMTAFPFPPAHGFFYVADRLGGFFQYPNVYALFCLTGIIILLEYFNGEKKEKFFQKNVCKILVLLSGILLSGSRIVFFLTLVSLAALILHKKINRKLLLPSLAVFVLIPCIFYWMGNTQNLGRIITTSLSSSTLLGRFIYAKDCFSLILRHPFGLGYLGYYYREPEIQTALYSVRFVHNDYLQLALDYGWIPCICILVLFIKTVLSHKYSFESRLLFAVWGIHLFFDFDMEFMSMWYLLLLFVDFNYGKELYLPMSGESGTAGRTKQRVIPSLVTVSVFLALYLSAGMLPRYIGRADWSSSILPFYTESNAELLSQEKDIGKAKALALKIKKQNPYVPECYDILTVASFMEGRYEEMAVYKKKAIQLQKYNLDAYEKYLMFLSKAIDSANTKGDMGTVVKLLPLVTEVPELLDDVEKNTTPLAFKTKDIPQFELSEDMQVYIKQVEAFLKTLQ